MSSDPDRYDAWYAAKLWGLLPAIYRAEDSEDVDRKGPLEELVDRIGAQTAIVRRSIDRLWEDQSIETCDDWIIDYLGDLLAANLVAGLDARGRRLEVHNTISYRRRKGTVGLLEELATDITGWDVRVVEMFRRLGRTRHGLDPALGERRDVQRAQGLIGARTRTPAGGLADLRDVHGASLTATGFDEHFHTGDVRRGRGATGWHDIAHLGVFVWRLRSLGVRLVTPVEDTTCTGTYRQYTFDPTGRNVPLFAAGGGRPFGDRWVSPEPHELGGPITPQLLAAAFPHLYPRSLGLYLFSDDLIRATDLAADPRQSGGKPWIDPERGRVVCPTAPADPFLVAYHHGFSSEIGAGGYDRPVPARPGDPAVEPPIVRFRDPSITVGASGTAAMAIENSLTYDDVDDIAVDRIELAAGDQERPLIRLAAGGAWTFTGRGVTATLLLDGIFVSGGGDLVLAGDFDQVVLSCCTLDPGTWTAKDSRWAFAADGRDLAPTRVWIEGPIRELVLDRSITGPIAARGRGRVETLIVRESIVQAARPGEHAIAGTGGEVVLSRSTLLGKALIHRLDASECILHDPVTVGDRQHGCVRFSAYATGSQLPRQYQSVEVQPGTALFRSRAFGRPEYAQLVDTAGPAIAEGAEDGSEMGAFWRERCALKERSLLIKYQEYMPLGLEPVVVHVS
jgi:hypothetical protein